MLYKTRYDAAITIARAVGDQIASRHFEPFVVDFKDSDANDPVTSLDQFAQKEIIRLISSQFKDDKFYAEEDDENSISLASENLWIIDPIDGTANFMHGLPLWGVSIAFSTNGKILFGIVYCPELSLFYEAYTGYGAFLNQKKMTVSSIPVLKKSVITSGLTHGLHLESGEENRIFSLFTSLLKSAQRVRILGSSVLQICEVASGHTEGFCGIQLKPWDFAASAVILKEAGGKITDFYGREIDLHTQDFICSNGIIHDKILDLCKDTLFN
ncbi:MAG TPA: inositol monophosphatase [Thermotogota bacterium]|nr:inositol monophosphatase [Thermotogota bacterium]HPR94863.1 inositol monophosphatase [Thermotogota bacterium]